MALFDHRHTPLLASPRFCSHTSSPQCSCPSSSGRSRHSHRSPFPQASRHSIAFSTPCPTDTISSLSHAHHSRPSLSLPPSSLCLSSVLIVILLCLAPSRAAIVYDFPVDVGHTQETGFAPPHPLQTGDRAQIRFLRDEESEYVVHYHVWGDGQWEVCSFLEHTIVYEKMQGSLAPQVPCSTISYKAHLHIPKANETLTKLQYSQYYKLDVYCVSGPCPIAITWSSYNSESKSLAIAGVVTVMVLILAVIGVGLFFCGKLAIDSGGLQAMFAREDDKKDEKGRTSVSASKNSNNENLYR